jgi:hypothetical protein
MNPSEPIPPSAANEPVPADWTRLPHEHLPPPTFWPAGLGLAITFLFWGLVSSWVLLTVGLVLFVVSLGGWVADLRHEGREHHS